MKKKAPREVNEIQGGNRRREIRTINNVTKMVKLTWREIQLPQFAIDDSCEGYSLLF